MLLWAFAEIKVKEGAQVNKPVVIAMVPVDVVEVGINQKIHVVTMLHQLVPTRSPMFVLVIIVIMIMIMIMIMTMIMIMFVTMSIIPVMVMIMMIMIIRISHFKV